MKKLIPIITALVLFSSCSDDFLNLAPQSTPNENTFFKTEGHFNQAVGGIYNELRETLTWPGFLIGESRSDNTHYILSSLAHSFRPEDVTDFVDDDQNKVTNNMYDYCYKGISRANTVLSRIEGTDFPEEFKNSIVGQSKFLRAYYYFMLVRCFGGVSLHLDEVRGTDNAFLPRSSAEDVYKAIINDATDAIAKLKAPEFPQTGFATQGSARMLLAQVLMTKPDRDYAGAETQLREIMKMGYKLLPDYDDVFDTSNKNNEESIFEVQYQQGNQGQQSNWLYLFMPKTPNGVVITGVEGTNTMTYGGYNTPTQDLIDSYEPGDLRLNTSVAVAAGHNSEDGSFIPDAVLNVGDPKIKDYPVSYYFINKYRHAHARVDNTDDNWPIYRYSDVLLSLAECLVEQGKAAEAVQYVNQVRVRAGLPEVSAVDKYVVANERRHELAFENHRWFDLVRTGMAISVMNEYGKKAKKLYPYLQERTYNVTQDRLIFPIPFKERQVNTQLTQNPGY